MTIGGSGDVCVCVGGGGGGGDKRVSVNGVGRGGGGRVRSFYEINIKSTRRFKGIKSLYFELLLCACCTRCIECVLGLKDLYKLRVE